MKNMMIGATLIKKGAAELHRLLPPRCKDHPALVDDAAKAEVTPDALLLTLLEPVEPAVVVPDGGRTADESTAAELMSVELGMVKELGVERDVTSGSVVVPEMESDDADDDGVPGPDEEIRVIAKAGLVSPESPNTRNITYYYKSFSQDGIIWNMKLTDNEVVVSWWYVWNRNCHIPICEIEVLGKGII